MFCPKPCGVLVLNACSHVTVHAGLELFFIEGGGGPQWGAPSAFLAFPNAVEAGKAAQAMLAQPLLGEALPGGKAAASAAGSILEVKHCICVVALQLRDAFSPSKASHQPCLMAWLTRSTA